MALSVLDPASMHSDERNADVKADIPENIDTRRYMDKMSEVRMLRDSIDRLGLAVEDARLADDEEAVLDGEFALTALRDSLTRASRLLQEIEMEFLFSGVVIDPDKLMAEADREITGQNVDYVFTRKAFGESLSLNMLDPEPEFDYSFKILDEGQFAEDNVLPSGLVYCHSGSTYRPRYLVIYLETPLCLDGNDPHDHFDRLAYPDGSDVFFYVVHYGHG